MRPDRQDDAVLEALRRIERWHLAHGSGRFEPPAVAAVIEHLAGSLGRPMPDALRTLLGSHDGCPDPSYPLPMRATGPACWRLLAAAEIEAEATRLAAIGREVGAGVKVRTVGPVLPSWWSSGWIPIAEDGAGDRVCIDCTPTAGGVDGQLVLYAHDVPERRVLHGSLAAWLVEAADDLDAGRYRDLRGVGLVRDEVHQERPPGRMST